MSEFSGNDDFEKVEPDNYGAFQDESITSSSMQGDMAEEDRYPSNEQDLLGDFSVGGMMASSTNSAADPPPAAAPLINFGENLMNPESTVSESAPDSAPEPITETKPVKPSAPPAEGLMGVPGMQTMGCWMKNVDPRDEDSAISDPSVADMDELQNTANTAAAAATDYATAAFEQAADSVTAPETVTGQSGGEPSGQSSSQPSQEVNLNQESSEVKGVSETVSESESSGEYSGELSSSGEESDSINSDMESSEEDFETKASQKSVDPSKSMEDVTTEECTVDSVYSDNQSTENDLSENMEMEISENTGSFDKAAELDSHEGMELENVSQVESIPQDLLTEIKNDNFKQDSLDIEDSGLENPDSLSEGIIRDSITENDDNTMPMIEKDEIVSADALLEQIESLTEDSFYEELDDNVIGGVGEANVNLTASEKERLDSSADEIVTEELECLQHTLDDLTDKGAIEKDTEYSSVGMSEDEMNKILEKLTSDGEECVDSVEKDEYLDNIDSPSFEDVQIVPSQPSENSSDESVCSDVSEDGSSIDSDESGDEPAMGTWNPSPLHSLDDDDSGDDDVAEVDLEEQMLDQNLQAAILSGYKYVEESNEEKLAFLEQEEKEGKQDDKEYKDTCRVQFSIPTNTIFYDPESPIVERVSVEVTDDLIDDQAKDIEKSKETQIADEENGETETGKDLASFSLYKSIRRKESTERENEIEGAMELIQNTGLDELRSLASQLRHDDRDIKLDNLQDVTGIHQTKNEETYVPDDMDTEVVLRRKNNRNVTEEFDRNEIDSMIIHDIEEPEVEITDVVQTETEPEGATGLDYRGSMIIYEEENSLLTEAVDSLNEMIPDCQESDKGIVGRMMSVEESDEAEIEQSLTHDKQIIEEMIESHATSKQESAYESCNKNSEDQHIENYAAEVAAQIIDDINYECLNTENDKVDEQVGFVRMDEQNNNVDEAREALMENSDPNESFEETCFEKSMETTIIETGGFEENNDQNKKDIDSTASDDINQLAEEICGNIVKEVEAEAPVNVNNLEIKTKIQEQAIEKTVLNEVQELQAKPIPKDSEHLNEAVSSTVTQEEAVEVPAEKRVPTEAVVASVEPENMAYSAVRTDRARSSFSEKVTTMLLDVTSEVLEIIYWRDVKKTGVVFGSMMFVLLSLSLCSLLSVLAYLSLAVLAVTFSFRVYKSVMQAVQKTNEGHPFKKLMDLDIELRGDVVQDAAQKIAENVNNCSRELRRLYLVGDYVDSLKFGLLLWLMTYIGSWFNGMTLVILLVVSIFTLPKVYETYQGPIDQNVNLVRAQLNNIMAQVSAKIPFPKKKAKTQ